MRGTSPSKRASHRLRLRSQPSGWSFVGWSGVVLLFSLPGLYRLRSSGSLDLPGAPRVDINAADSLQLLSLSGMMPWKVHRLLYWRRALGGFWDTVEVRVVLDSLNWRAIAAEVEARPITSPPTHPLNLNAVDSGQLAASLLCRSSIAGRFIRYRYKLGGFSDWAEIDSFRGLHALERHRLRIYGSLGGVSLSFGKERRGPWRLDLNAATAAELEQLPGIGTKSAERIVKYRAKLRYFISLEQLREIWGLRPEAIQKSIPYLYIGPPKRPPLSLRYAPVESLAAHPYISWKLARRLVQERTLWGPEPIPPEIWQGWLPDSLKDRLKGYLTGE
ncbi:MAG: helix-hairpin-helix domain-containing protein [Bacteroidia bacterium]|nr:helix-hairpin-helix domain-containing protein [Bacteroidia bacterium]